MSGSFSYRLYKVEVRRCNERKAMLEGKLAGQSMADFMYNQMQELSHPQMREPSVVIAPEDLQPNASIDDISGKPCFCVKDCRRFGDVLVASVAYGRYGEMEWLFDRSGRTEDIREKAASSLYEVRIAFPRTSQGETDKNVCYMACKMNGRSEQGRNLLQYISYVHHRSISKVPPDNPEVTVPDGEWYKFVATPVIDPNRFDAVIASAQPQKITLEMRSADGFGSRASQSMALTVSDINLAWRFRVGKILKKWIKAVQRGLSLGKPQAAQDLAKLIPKGMSIPKKMLRNGAITYEENGHTKTVNAETVDQLFVYPMPDGSTASDLWTNAGDNLQLIASADEYHCDIPAINV